MIINRFIRFYKYASPNIPGSLIKNMIYKILWRLNLVKSPSMGCYKEYIDYKKMWVEVGDIIDNKSIKRLYENLSSSRYL